MNVSGSFKEQKVQKNSIHLKYKYFVTVNVFTVFFYQFNVFLLNKSLTFKKKKWRTILLTSNHSDDI